nr:hypothetical protein [Tanacetum cinerariifolium]
MPENGGIANLAPQGGSGEGYGSLPTDFGVVEGRSMGKEFQVVLKVSQLAKKTPGGYTPIASLVLGQYNFYQLAEAPPGVAL